MNYTYNPLYQSRIAYGVRVITCPPTPIPAANTAGAPGKGLALIGWEQRRDNVPRFFRGLNILDQIDILRRNHPFVYERLEVEHTFPKGPAKDKNRQGGDLVRLDQG